MHQHHPVRPARIINLSLCTALLATCGCAVDRGPSLADTAPGLDSRISQPEGTVAASLAQPWDTPTALWDGTSPLSLDTAIRCALVENRMLRRTLAEADRRRAALSNAQLPPNPTLSLAVGAPLGMGVAPVLAALAGQVDWLWKRDAIVGEADAQLRSLLLESAAMVASTVAEVRGAYIEVAATTQLETLARRDGVLAGRVLSADLSALSAGEATHATVAQARMDAAEAANQQLETDVAIVTAKTRLLEAIGRGGHDLQWTIVATDVAQALQECPLPDVPPADAEDAIQSLVRAHRMDIRAADARAQGAQARARLAATGALPTLMLGAGYDRDMESEDSAMVLLESQLPLFNDGRFQVEAAQADAEVARIDADRIRQRAVIDARRAIVAVTAAQHHAQTLRDGTIAAFAARQQVLADSVQAGERPKVDLWRSEHQENHLLLQLVRAERDHALAAIAFEQALAGGRLPSMQGGAMAPGASASMGGPPANGILLEGLEAME